MSLPVNILRIFFIKDPPFYRDISSALKCFLVVIAKDALIITQKGIKVNNDYAYLPLLAGRFWLVSDYGIIRLWILKDNAVAKKSFVSFVDIL